MYKPLELWLLVESFLSAQVMASTILQRRYSNTCPNGDYTASNGLTFTTTNLCLHNIAGDDITQQSTNSLEDCMALCSTSPAGVACGGVAYNFNAGTCWMKNTNISSATISSDSGTHSALTTNFQISTDISCPYPNGTDRTTADGMEFEIMCNQNMPLDDYCPDGGPTPVRADGLCPYHASTIDDCTAICSEAAPLCKAIVWNPDMTGGYGNCYLKSGISAANYESVANAAPASHMAVAVNIPTLDESCTNASTTTATGGATYLLSCNDNRAGNDIEQVHAENITSCVDACSTYSNATNNCVGVMYDSTMASGWRWLKSADGTTSSIKGNIFAVKTSNSSSSTGSSPGSSSSGSSGSSGSHKSSNKGWIAGAVIGPLAGVALVGLAVWYFRRRRTTKVAPYPLSELPDGPPPVYAKEKVAQEEPIHEIGEQGAPTKIHQAVEAEADSGEVHELPAFSR